jgi:hypothetical protein
VVHEGENSVQVMTQLAFKGQPSNVVTHYSARWSKSSWLAHYLGIDVDDALEMAEHTEVSPCAPTTARR